MSELTLDEAIKHCLEVAERYETRAKIIDRRKLGFALENPTACHECAADHRQLAEWLTELKELKAADIQPVDTKEILRHLDSMMICIGNAYDTSHGLLRSDMEFIEKQEKIIKELLSDKLETRNADNNYSQFIKDIEQEPISEMRGIREGWGNE